MKQPGERKAKRGKKDGDMMKKLLLLNKTNSRLECKTDALFMTKMAGKWPKSIHYL